jgi:exodeoxyribonuclease V alpha subunit
MGESVRGRLGAGGAGVRPRRCTGCCGQQPGGGFHHGEGNPLPYKAVIVDEASMIDLALMERLVAALSDDARLILIGDPDQLPSVEAGQVLTDLIADAAAGGRAPPRVARLTRSYRVEAGDGWRRSWPRPRRCWPARPSASVPVAATAWPRSGPAPPDVVGRGVEFVAADVAGTLSFVDHWWRQRWQSPRRRRPPRVPSRRRSLARRRRGDALAELLAAHEASRLLAVTRSRALGSVGLSATAATPWSWPRRAVDGAPEFLPGEPVIQTRNDYARGLWNGDQGVVVRVSDDGGPQHYRVVFRKSLVDDRVELAPFPIDALRGGLELAWAMTVHKSQGSEFGQVALMLPRPTCRSSAASWSTPPSRERGEAPSSSATRGSWATEARGRR